MLDQITNEHETNANKGSIVDGVELIIASFDEDIRSPETTEIVERNINFDVIAERLRNHAKQLHNSKPRKSKAASDSADLIEEAQLAIEALKVTQLNFADFANTQQDAHRKKIEFLEKILKIVNALNRSFMERSVKSKRDFFITFETIADERLRNHGVSFTTATSLETKALRYATYGRLKPSTEKSWAAILRNAQKVDAVVSGEISLAVWIASVGGFASAAKSQTQSQKNNDAENLRAGVINFAKSWAKYDDHSAALTKASQLTFKKTGYSNNAKEDIKNFTIVLKMDDVEIVELKDGATVEAALKSVSRVMKEYPSYFMTVDQRKDIQAQEAAQIELYKEVTGDTSTQRNDTIFE